jgi:GDP/UDP-N,N'-diacetylbacillosamine 2-epimerase (hydrolysing)
VTPRRIAIVTTSRADFGILRELIRAVDADPALAAQVIVSGMHLSAAFGSTWREIEREGVSIAAKVSMPGIGRSAADNCTAIGRGLGGFATTFSKLKSEIVVLLGDRLELLAPATAALALCIPIAHIHGGELSEGAIDDSVRHAITKMASLHFPATAVYRQRILQMGERPKRVFQYGAPGLDALYRTPLPSRSELEQELGLDLAQPTALVTYHPVTRDAAGEADVKMQAERIAEALCARGLRAIITAANADALGRAINARFEALCAASKGRFLWMPHLGHRRYLGCLGNVAVMVGNSSSGLTEAPSFRLPVVNIGDRQRGRVRAANVLDVRPTRLAIERGIARALSPGFSASLRGMRNPYERFRDGAVSQRIAAVLRDTELNGDLLKKGFYGATQ